MRDKWSTGEDMEKTEESEGCDRILAETRQKLRQIKDYYRNQLKEVRKLIIINSLLSELSAMKANRLLDSNKLDPNFVNNLKALSVEELILLKDHLKFSNENGIKLAVELMDK
ncbi:unnamed protein product [Medioppia subpectinata]|uniref:Uncharacterized protein n=1 Tax=Medioppia subpectinata TaxID=1979941 RepID=A0A7R9LB11_9ACAR|nr:unnamed protein product [Medioppia subpectinata]CAG2117392.1 unnamed protein product [Medioppia subpectinata]